ncbi:hypothetical protein [Alteromonas sp. a30]|uniref:hypothetical protein n=1 Tax=Alteromonas sp. a30 TaxID=2730917 RepID=UPI00228190DC|nr:hypothetical protein [Alteromonas sp. a30]MCY7296746.1 hypothetical protein [Alteromonas sp. a30]
MKNYGKKISSWGGCLCFLLFSIGVSANTPNHVYQAVDNLANNIEAIRAHLNVNDTPRLPGVQIAKTPLHAYTKGLEVFEKVIRFKKSKNLATIVLPDFPDKAIKPSDVLVLVETISKEIQQASKQLGVSYAERAKLPTGKTPSDVYENMWRTSYLLDGLAGAISPKYVYRNTLRIEKALEVIAQELNTKVDKEVPELPANKKPVDANIEGYKVLYKIAQLEKRLNMDALRVPGFPAGDISPSDVYDTTNNILAELTRINLSLSLSSPDVVELDAETVTPSHVVRQFQSIQHQLDMLIN